ncbi:MAG TPA: RDD family protein, partial [Acidimicrobiales bacterium]|nr:RDD family protein [Acidimicrobiales bacterium]
GQQRYWDGSAWTDNTAPGVADAPIAPPAPPMGGYAPPPGGYGAPAGGYGPPMGAYGAPTQVGYGYAHVPAAPLAGFGSRLGAFLVDAILLGIVTSIIAAILGIDAFETSSIDGTRRFSATGGYNLLQFVIALPYYVYLEGTSGQTLGKKLLGITVVHADTLQPGVGLGRATGRYFARWLSAIVCLLGYLWMLWDNEKQTWHDKLAGTKVVKGGS